MVFRGDSRTVDLTVTVKALDGTITDQHRFPGVQLKGGCTLTKLPPFLPKLPAKGYCAIDYVVTER